MASNPRRTNSHRRNQLRARILARDTHCWAPWCKQGVDKSLPPGLPMSPEVHEVLPVSRGGSPYDPDNCVLTHRLCNQRIGNRTPAELARENVKPKAIVTLAKW